MSALLTRDLDVILGSSRILHGISVSIEEGSAVAVLGANGSGKSTLIRAMMGIIPSARGTVEIFGHDITDRSRVPWKRMGYVPQRVAAASGVPATALEVLDQDPRGLGVLNLGEVVRDVGDIAQRVVPPLPQPDFEQRLGARHQLGRQGFFKAQQLVGRLDLDALARIQLNLGRRLGLGKNAAGEKFAGLVE